MVKSAVPKTGAPIDTEVCKTLMSWQQWVFLVAFSILESLKEKEYISFLRFHMLTQMSNLCVFGIKSTQNSNCGFLLVIKMSVDV